MAQITKLSMTFMTTEGSAMTLAYKYADPEVSTANVKALVNGIIANGEIFSNIPVTAKGAKLVTTDEEAIDIAS